MSITRLTWPGALLLLSACGGSATGPAHIQGTHGVIPWRDGNAPLPPPAAASSAK